MVLESIQHLAVRFANEGSHWQFLSRYFHPSLTRFFVSWFALAPLSVKALEIVSRAQANHPILMVVGNLELPFSWTVLWFASFAYFVAFLLYTFTAPGFMQRYPSYLAYAQRGHSPRWLVWEAYYAYPNLSSSQQQKLLGRLVTKKFARATELAADPMAMPTVEQDGTKWTFIQDGKPYVLAIDENLSEERQKDFFWEIFGRYSASRQKTRYLIWVLLFLAILLTAFVVGQNIWFVLRYLFS